MWSRLMTDCDEPANSNTSSPQLRRVIEFAYFESRDSLQFGKVDAERIDRKTGF